MRIGTTPTFTFELPISTDLVRKAKVTFRQNRTIVLEKKEECMLKDNCISVSLTQEETFKFDPRYEANAQLRVVDTAGSAFSTDIYTIEVKECLDREVL